MAFLKFITICDDELLPNSVAVLKKYDITALPSIYFCDNTPYIDTVNSDSEMFFNFQKTDKITSFPTVPADVFEHEINQAYNIGYFGVLIVLPHNKWTDYKHQAEIAKKRFMRKNKIDEQGFQIHFYDSKTFAGGTISLTIDFARRYHDYHLSVDNFLSMLKHNKLDKITYILSKDENIFDSEKGLKGYIIRNNNLFRMNISQYSDSVIFDLFAKEFVNNTKNLKYNVSIGYNCDFGGNVLGRIESMTGLLPAATSKYGISTTQILGNSSICINGIIDSDNIIFR